MWILLFDISTAEIEYNVASHNQADRNRSFLKELRASKYFQSLASTDEASNVTFYSTKMLSKHLLKNLAESCFHSSFHIVRLYFSLRHCKLF